jgi:hypothetical protein
VDIMSFASVPWVAARSQVGLTGDMFAFVAAARIQHQRGFGRFTAGQRPSLQKQHFVRYAE